jgi:hypothetical protein
MAIDWRVTVYVMEISMTREKHMEIWTSAYNAALTGLLANDTAHKMATNIPNVAKAETHRKDTPLTHLGLCWPR